MQNFISLGIISEIDNNVAESMFDLNLGEMEENPISFPETQLYQSDWKRWLHELKQKKESCLVHTYNLLQIWIVNILDFLYCIIFFYFIPFFIVIFVQFNGKRPLEEDSNFIEKEKGNSDL